MKSCLELTGSSEWLCLCIPIFFHLTVFNLLLSACSIKKESLPLRLYSKVLEAPKHDVTVAAPVFITCNQNVLPSMNFAMHLCFPTWTVSTGTHSSRCSSCLKGTLQTSYGKVCFLFDFMFILAKPLELMFVILKQL